jgi:hypothetical protein
MSEYFGTFLLPTREGTKVYHVWVLLEGNELQYVHVGQSSGLLDASSALTRTICEQAYPGLWRQVEERVEVEIDVEEDS